jgi:16S rRNA processing protein RimM
MKKRFLDSGKIVGTHGIKGELRIDPWCDSPEFLCCFKKLYLDEQGRESIKVKSRPHKNIVLCKVDGIDTIEQADKMRGKIVYIDREDIALDEGVNFVQDLIGLEVKDADSETVYGKITDVLRVQTMFTRLPMQTAKSTLRLLLTRLLPKQILTADMCLFVL